jgi:hypothetical protein
MGAWDSIDKYGSDIMSSGTNQIFGGDLKNPFGGIENSLGFQNPNETQQGKDLQAQKGNAVTWGSTADLANKTLGNNLGSPQIAAPTWQQGQLHTGTASLANGAQAGPAPQAGLAQTSAASMGGVQLDQTQANQTRDAQNQLAGSLQNTANGQGPSVAQELLRQNTAANINQQNSAAQSMHGAARLAALRNASMTGAATQQTANSQAAALHGQEIASAQGNLGNVLGTSRGQDVTTAAQNAGLAQQTGQINSGYQQNANNLNAQMLAQNNQYNAGLGQQTNLANAQLLQNSGQYNANNLQNMTQFNTNAANVTSNNFAANANAGNLALANANLQAQQQTNQLNTQRGIANINAAQGAAAGQTGIDTTAYNGTLQYNQGKQQMVGQGLNSLGQAMPALGALL